MTRLLTGDTMDKCMNLYLLLFFATLIEGPVATTLAGFWLHFGQFSVWPAFLALVIGDLCGDVFWYYLGRYQAQKVVTKYGRFVSVTPKILTGITQAFKRHERKILFFSKLTMGFGFAIPVLIAAGSARIPFRRFMTYDTVGQLLWTGLLMSIGYFFGNFYVTLNQGFKIISLVSGVIMLVLGLWGIRLYLKNRKIYQTL